MSSFSLIAKSPDDFITDIIDLNQEKAVEAFRTLVLNRSNPSMDELEMLERYRKLGLAQTANYLHALI